MNNFIKDIQTVVIGTIDSENHPFSSYAPYVHEERFFYIYISDIAKHAQNLQANTKCSLFFIEDESKSENLFARKRVSLQCEASKVDRESDCFDKVLNRFAKKFDEKTVSILRTMTDFNLYAIHATSGEATFGFGEAYTIGGTNMDELLPRKGGGHGHTSK